MKVDSVNNSSRGVCIKSSTKNIEHGKADVIIDSLSIAERNAGHYSMASFYTNYFNSGLSALLVVVPFSMWINKNLRKISHNETVIKFAGISLPPLALLWGFIANKNANNNALAQKTGYYKTLSKDLADTESFAILNQDQEQEFKETDTYKKIKQKRFNSSVSGTTNNKPVITMNKIKSDTRKYKKNIEINNNIMSENNDSGYVSDLIKNIDSRATRYESKITQGLNLFYASMSMLSLIAVALMNKLGKNSEKSSTLNLTSLIITLVPILLQSNISSRPSDLDIHNFSRYVAAHNIKSELSGDNSKSKLDNGSIFSGFKFYFDNRKKVRRLMSRDAYLAKYKNFYKKNINLSSEQLRNAKQLKEEFQKTIMTRMEDDKIDRLSVKRSFLKDFLINTSIMPICLLLMPSVLNIKNNNKKNLIISSGILSALSIMNALFAKCKYKTSAK